MNTEPLDPTKTDQSELIIDPEAITQWVDGKLPTPHKMSVELLAEKFGSLNDYNQDVTKIRELLQASLSPRIAAPAHTICKVLMAINEQADEKFCSCAEKDGNPSQEATKEDSSSETQEIVAPASVKKRPSRSPDSLPFEIEFPQHNKKRNAYILPAAAVLILSLLVGAIFFSENYSGHTKKHTHQSIAETAKGKKRMHDRKAASMNSSLPTPHSVPMAENVQMTNNDEVRSPHDETDKAASQKEKKEEAKEKNRN